MTMVEEMKLYPYLGNGEELHVIPDNGKHICSVFCWCEPSVELEFLNLLVIHNDLTEN